MCVSYLWQFKSKDIQFFVDSTQKILLYILLLIYYLTVKNHCQIVNKFYKTSALNNCKIIPWLKGKSNCLCNRHRMLQVRHELPD